MFTGNYHQKWSFAQMGVLIMTLIRTLVRSIPVLGLVALLLLPAGASAESLMIQYTGLDISYSGTTITEVGNPDTLSSLVFSIDGVELGPVLTSGISIELSIPGVSGLPVAGGSDATDVGGSLGLTLPGGDFVNLELGAGEVQFMATSGVIKLYFVMSASEATVLSQSLPIDGLFDQEVAVSFSSQVKSGTLTQSGGIVTGFKASGTGEIEGDLVPEPTTVALLLSGLLAGVFGIRRRG
jgi:hypothetical protein